ncbi:MAG: hypothetical protein ABIK79_03865 [Chloroflexota bacterium]
MSELADFVLNVFRRSGGIVEPPAYGVYEVLLPDEAARRWNVPAYQRLAFADEVPAETAATEDVNIVSYGHPLLEKLMEEIRAERTCVLAYINDVRLDKRGLLTLARQTLAFPNARLSDVPHKSKSAALCYYVRFNFKAALITDEKRERLVSVVMDAQAGFVVPELADAEQIARLEEEPTSGHLPTAPVRWLPGNPPLSRAVLDGLLERATHAALDELAEPLETLRRRAARHLELDGSRLTGYYDDIAHDLQHRLQRSTDPARRAALEDKLTATQAEREAKLADIEAKYHLRAELELINLQVIGQPKILLPVKIANRPAKVERTVIWDPLFHRIEPLACEVCGRSATRLMLCAGGHLVHEQCLLPEQCVDCKRIYCRLCADQINHCAVCDRPVCTHSLNRCKTCGRSTCHEHVGLCHAAAGEPVQLPPLEAPKAVAPPVEKVEEEPAPPLPPRGRQNSAKGKLKTAARATRRARRPVTKKPRTPTLHKIEVYVDPGAPIVTAYVLTKGKKQIAVRVWELMDEGIVVTCLCEKAWGCPTDGRLLEPEGPSRISAQIEEQIEDLRQEYGISTWRVFRHAIIHGAPQQVPRVVLRDEWKMER